MSTELTRSRQLLSQVGTHLKSKKPLAATKCLEEALSIVVRSPLMRSEREEFTNLIEQAVFQVSRDRELMQKYAVLLEYKPGEEKALLGNLRNLISELEASQADSAQAAMESFAQKKQKYIEQGDAALRAVDPDKAGFFFEKAVAMAPDDTDLKSDIADRYLTHGYYKEAFKYLNDALENDPNAVHLYNRIGIVLRKMGDFRTAEKYYKRALEVAEKDEFLFFNIGRLYVDMAKWDKVAWAAEQALEINPNFKEGQKMLAFARKKVEAE
jgi:tetratricopeptide (TPR) repeat protein